MSKIQKLKQNHVSGSRPAALTGFDGDQTGGFRPGSAAHLSFRQQEFISTPVVLVLFGPIKPQLLHASLGPDGF